MWPMVGLHLLPMTRNCAVAPGRIRGIHRLANFKPLKMVFSFSRDFVKAFIQFKKPIVVAINGPALGLGASILPLCDIVWASEKAWFQTPYATIRLTPAGCSSYTFPQILGVALVSLLFPL